MQDTLQDQQSRSSFFTEASKGHLVIFCFLEIIFHLLAFIPAAYLIKLSVEAGSVFWLVPGVIFGLVISKIFFVILLGFAIAMVPKPTIGPLINATEGLKFNIISTLSKVTRNSLVRSDYYLLPFPGNLYFKLAGAKLGKSCRIASPDSINHPFLLEMGDYSVLGENCSVLGSMKSDNSSAIELGKVKLGNFVVVGRGAKIWPNVTVEDRGVILSNANVLPGTVIGKQEVWGGSPAQLLSGPKVTV